MPRAESQLRSYAAEVRQAIDGRLDLLLPSDSNPPVIIHQAMRHAVFAGGKRIRPLLLVASGELFGAGREELLSAAAALEMIHTFSLVHDDLPALDDDDLRRGQPTLHRRFDESTAILAGDALLNLGLACLAGHPPTASAEVRVTAVSWTAEAVGTSGMIGGQVEDLAAERCWPQDPNGALERIHQGKTAALLSLCLRLGGLYAAAEQPAMVRLGALGNRLGLLFQVADDILDVEGTTAALGKTAGKDAAAAKLTYPGLYGLARAKALAAQLEEECAELCGSLPQGGGVLAEIVTYIARRDH